MQIPTRWATLAFVVAVVAIGAGATILVTFRIAAHGSSQYRIAVKVDAEDIVFRYQERPASAGQWKTTRIFRAVEPRNGVWYNGKAEDAEITVGGVLGDDRPVLPEICRSVISRFVEGMPDVIEAVRELLDGRVLPSATALADIMLQRLDTDELLVLRFRACLDSVR